MSEEQKQAVEEIDYKALLAEREVLHAKELGERDNRLAKVEETKENLRVALQQKRKDNQLNQQDPSIEENPDDEIVRRVERKLRLDEIDDTIAALTDDEDEAKLIKSIYENDIQHKGYSRKQIGNDLAKARLLANQHKFEADAVRKAKKSVAEESAIKSSSITTRASVDEKIAGKKYTEAEKRYLRKMGVKI